MIRDLLIPAIKHRFSEIGFTFLETPQPFARVSCPCAEMGELEIDDDEFEATIAITRVTHSHFNPYKKLPDAERDGWVTAAVIEYLEALFEDRLLVYCARDGNRGGSERHESPIDRSKPVVGMEGYDCYVWSGPVAQKKSLR